MDSRTSNFLKSYWIDLAFLRLLVVTVETVLDEKGFYLLRKLAHLGRGGGRTEKQGQR